MHSTCMHAHPAARPPLLPAATCLHTLTQHTPTPSCREEDYRFPAHSEFYDESMVLYTHVYLTERTLRAASTPACPCPAPLHPHSYCTPLCHPAACTTCMPAALAAVLLSGNEDFLSLWSVFLMCSLTSS